MATEHVDFNSYSRLRYPGDPEGPGAEVNNCRCTLMPAVDGVDQDSADRWGRLPEGMTYEEWKAGADLRIQSGALNDENDPDGWKRNQHANTYYESVRNRDRKTEITMVAKNSGFDKETVSIAYRHVFIEKHDLAKGHVRFDPDYDMAQSWQRLRNGKGIQKHDRTLIAHEAREAKYMKMGLDYDTAHAKACSDGYNYQKELDEWTNGKE